MTVISFRYFSRQSSSLPPGLRENATVETFSSVLVGSRLRAARKHAGLSQRELAERCSTRQSHISSMEKELRAPSIEMLKRLADVLGVSVQWLCGYDQTPTEAPAEIGPKHLLSDASTAAGLVALAADRALADSLDIQPAEWSALRSLAPAAAISKEGYLAVLLALRAHKVA